MCAGHYLLHVGLHRVLPTWGPIVTSRTYYSCIVVISTPLLNTGRELALFIVGRNRILHRFNNLWNLSMGCRLTIYPPLLTCLYLVKSSYYTFIYSGLEKVKIIQCKEFQNDIYTWCKTLINQILSWSQEIFAYPSLNFVRVFIYIFHN